MTMGAAPLTVGRLTVRGDAASGRAAARRLAALMPDPPGAPGEVLILRHLDDPLPGGLTGEDGDERWVRALAGRLSEARHGAVRPLRGGVDPSAGAVLFADAAEALACLLRDRARGGALPWWWQRWPDAGAATGDLGTLLCAAPVLLPAVLGVLADAGEARALAALSPREIAAVEAALGLDAAPPPAAAAPAMAAPQGAAGGRPPRRLRPSPGPATAPSPAALRLPEAAATSPDGARAAQDIALAAPGPVAPPTPSPSETAALAAVPRAVRAMLAAALVLRRRPGLAGPALRAVAAAFAEAAVAVAPSADRPARSDRAAPQGQRDLTVREPDPAARPGAVARTVAPQPAPDADAPRSRRPAAEDRNPPAPPQPKADAVASPAIRTAFGGAIYLVGLLERPAIAEAVAAASEPAQGPWARLVGIARALLGDADDPGDPLWPALAALDGEAAASATPAPEAAVAPIRAILAQAEPAAPPAELLRVPAEIVLSPVRLDAILPMEAVRLGLRLAGIDLDPGWSAGFGRFVFLHFRATGGLAP